MLKASDLYSIPADFAFRDFFSLESYPWEWLPKIKEALANFSEWNGQKLETPPSLYIGKEVYIGKGVLLPAFGSIEGPAYIGDGCQLRSGVYIRGNVITGKNCVLGNSCEYKNCLLFDQVESPHYNYVGDSILGTKSHLGAGAILSNLRLDKKNICIKTPEGYVNTGMRKIGGILGEGSQVGCNSTLNPGTILAKGSIVYPNLAFAGFLGEGKTANRGI